MVTCKQFHMIHVVMIQQFELTIEVPTIVLNERTEGEDVVLRTGCSLRTGRQSLRLISV